jgi:putative ABC transport system permease protein
MMSQFWHDFLIGVRRIRRSPGFAAMAISTLALGIGVNTAVFSIVNTVLLQPPPVKDAASVRSILHRHIQRGFTQQPSPYPDLVDWRSQIPSFEKLAGVWSQSMNMGGAGDPERVLVGKADREFFPMLGVQPVTGRGFRPEEDQPGAARVAILSHELWTRRYGSDPNLDNLRLALEGETYSIVGVLPEGFRFVGRKADLYIPLASAAVRGQRSSPVNVYGRLRPGATQAALEAELAAATRALDTITPRHKGWRLEAGDLGEYIVADVRASLWMLLGAVGIVLLVACANVANLLLLRAAEQRRDMAVRMAMGAGSMRLVRQFLAESLPLAGAGAGLGLLLAWGFTRLAPYVPAERIPRLAETRLDWTVLAFTAGIALLTLFLAAALPAYTIARTDPELALKEAGRNPGVGRGGQRLRGLLVATECALALLLSVGAILMARTFSNLASTSPGFRTAGMLVANLELPTAKYAAPERSLDFHRRLLESVRGLPGVQSATVTNSLPLGGMYMRGDFPVKGVTYPSPKDQPLLNHRTVDFDYFRTLDIRVLRGRGFTDEDRETSAPVLVLNQAAAKRLFGDADPLGAQVWAEGKTRTVVGIVPNVRHSDVSRGDETEALIAFAQNPSTSSTIVVRLDPGRYPEPLQFAPVLRQAVGEVDQNQAISRVTRFDRLVEDRLSPRWLNRLLLGSFAALALLLAAIGLYGVLSYAVERRAREFGIRLALGARPADVVRLVLRQGVGLAAAGILVGIAASMALSQTIQSVLFGVSPTEPDVLAAAALVLLLVAAAASYWPARRAIRVDPSDALRAE